MWDSHERTLVCAAEFVCNRIVLVDRFKWILDCASFTLRLISLDLVLVVLLLELPELLLGRHRVWLLCHLRQKVVLILVNARLERDEFADGAVDLAESGVSSCVLASVAAHVIVLILHLADRAVWHSHGLRVDSEEALVAILLHMVLGPEGRMHVASVNAT